MTQDPSTMYRWRQLTDRQREQVLTERRQYNRPPHSVPHIESDTTTYYMITAACFEHRHLIGKSPERMSAFERDLTALLHESCNQVFAWTILPNHYHCLVDAPDVSALLKSLGQLHGRSSFYWNGEDNSRGRQVWCNAAETVMKSERHFYATINYVLHNAVKHGYVQKWTQWPYCNANEYLESTGPEKALHLWKSYPISDYGNNWDPAEL
ncbi:hypothetical protein LF1_29190 [Rubripirellula obstinata]|uniref:Transposase IS200-like domain-containing protein n=1 Tax=Rubripirellula obstinata TaxID=406547 RepID=A0A5B1CKW5_9BACT|nr:transposase [Rubripirellula obstinata]KAA1260379.1 hypothetical protein LF1_29190 [Rubripirellula obstinata]